MLGRPPGGSLGRDLQLATSGLGEPEILLNAVFISARLLQPPRHNSPVHGRPCLGRQHLLYAKRT